MSSASTSLPRVHDLIGPIRSGAVVAENNSEQAAMDACLARAPFAVVRRAASVDGLVAVGVRGALRSERYPASIAREHAGPVTAPEDLRLREVAASAPALRALGIVEHRWAAFGLAWGPAGSVGFALASGADCVGPQSDLDLVVHVPALPTAGEAAAWLHALHGLPCRADVQVEAPEGGVALQELLSEQGRALLRTPHGPRLLDLASRQAADWQEASALSQPRLA